MTNEDTIHRLAEQSGIQPDYYDIWGQHHQISVQTKRLLLNAMGIADNEQAPQYLPLVWVSTDSQTTIELILPTTHSLQDWQWRLMPEDQPQQQGDLSHLSLQSGESFEHSGTTYQRWYWTLPILDYGYHQLSLQQSDTDNVFDCTIVLSPGRCYQPDCLKQGKRWGLSLQLYALRSQRNWGIGDFTDLKVALAVAAQLGAATVGLNPLHALFIDNADRCSPYSPTSRLFINPLYLDIEAIAEFKYCAEARKAVRIKAFQTRLKQLRATQFVDYSAVAEIKLSILQQLFQQFYQHEWQNPDSKRAQGLRDFQQQQGKALHHHALAEALQEWFHGWDPNCSGWPDWLPSYRQPDSELCQQFAQEHPAQILFYQYLQWQAHEQLNDCKIKAQELDLELGLYCDLAVGVSCDGAEVWADQDVYGCNVGIGAPPDDFSPGGQNWGLAPFKPVALRNTAYQAFIATLRASMRYAGALRIDHVMGLARLFWIPSFGVFSAQGISAEGAYVNYPFADLLNILALESQRNQCLIIGEDLGTVEDHVRHALADAGVLSYRVLYFEKHWQDDHSFKPPQDYPEQALVTASTHDLPTLHGFWEKLDLHARTELNLYPSSEAETSHHATRQHDKQRLLQALQQAGYALSGDPPGDEFNLAVQEYLSQSPAQLLLVQIEDAFNIAEQVNLPGTVAEYPNWRRRLPVALETWLNDERLQQLAENLNTQRGAV